MLCMFSEAKLKQRTYVYFKIPYSNQEREGCICNHPPKHSLYCFHHVCLCVISTKSGPGGAKKDKEGFEHFGRCFYVGLSR